MGRHPVLAAAAVLLTALIGCIAAGGDQASGRPTGSAATSNPAAHPYYVSIGDSYAAGMQPTSSTERHTTRNGFAYQLVGLARSKGYAFTLVNLGCGGATTGSLLHRAGCDHDRLGPGAKPYDGTTQAAAALSFIRAHRGRVGLITVSIGINDVLPCAHSADMTHCVAKEIPRIRKNLGTLLRELRSAAGDLTPIVGITYPDVLLAGLLGHSTAARRLAKVSVREFRSVINPRLRKSYQSRDGAFVDVTKATGAYRPLKEKTTLPPYGRIPVSVAELCRLTYECRFHDAHPRTKGYALIARRILDTLPTR